VYGQKALLVANKLDDSEKKADALCQYKVLSITEIILAIEYLLKEYISGNNKPLHCSSVFRKPI
jgi:hypothetical protein